MYIQVSVLCFHISGDFAYDMDTVRYTLFIYGQQWYSLLAAR